MPSRVCPDCPHKALLHDVVIILSNPLLYIDTKYNIQQMNLITSKSIKSNDIANMPFTTKELEHKSRVEQLYHVYVSFLFYAFSLCRQKVVKVVVDQKDDAESNGSSQYSSSSSHDSSDLVRKPTVQETVKLAGIVWKRLVDEQKDRWQMRANRLSRLPKNDGKFCWFHRG